MAELNLFHYLPKKSLLHNLDGRFKLICMIILTITTGFAARTVDLFILTSILLMALINAGLPVKKLFAEIKYFFFWIGMIILVHSLSVPGTSIAQLPIHGVSWEGLRSGLLFGWRLILIILMCTILTGTTSLSLLKNVIEWFLRPIPLIREARVATMFSLTFVLIPLFFDQAVEMLDAQKARCLDGRKNPVRRMIFLVFPLLLRTFRRADEMVLAMESRCYSEDRTPVYFKANLKDWLLLILAGLVGTLVFFRVY